MPFAKNIDGYDIRAQIVFERQVHKGGFLIVEGVDDDRSLSQFFDPAKCSIVVAYNKENALVAADLLDDDGYRGALCVVDADFDRLQGTRCALSNVVYTDCHDLDLTIFSTLALNDFLRVYADKKKLEVVERKAGPVSNLILGAATSLGCLRYVNHIENLNLCFRNLPYEEFISRSDLACDDAAMVRTVMNQSKRTRIDSKAILALVGKAKGKRHDQLQLCNGHDVAAILGIAMRELLGNRREMHTWRSEIEASLRLAFSQECFRSTKLYVAITDWDAENSLRCLLNAA